jgi:hypothetical protein
MISAHAYRRKATELRAIASTTRQLQFERLARAYLHLAAQADRNGGANLVYDTPHPCEDSRTWCARSAIDAMPPRSSIKSV